MVEQQKLGPGNSLFNIVQRIFTIVIDMVETRLRLLIMELEEEKFNIIQMLMMIGITLLFAAFGLMSLLVLVILAIDSQYRLITIATITSILLLLATFGVVMILIKARKSSLLSSTREELQIDRDILKNYRTQSRIKNQNFKHNEKSKNKQ